jgi:hypothetical protein
VLKDKDLEFANSIRTFFVHLGRRMASTIQHLHSITPVTPRPVSHSSEKV